MDPRAIRYRLFSRTSICAAAACSALAVAFAPVGVFTDAGAAEEGRANPTTVPHVLRFSTAEEIQTLDPEINAQTAVTYLSQMTMAYLFRFDRTNRLIPELATVVPTFENRGISKDGLTITVRLRRGVRWSDGQPFDADDVIFSWKAVMNPANLIPSRTGFDKIRELNALNKFTLVVHLREPYGAIVPTLFASAGGIAVLPKHILGGLPDINKASYNNLPVGIGPFRYVAWKRGEAVELEANPLYWRGKPKLERIVDKLIPDRNTVLTQLQTGELDLWHPFGGAYLGRVQAIHSVAVLRRPAYSINEFVLNMAHRQLADETVRRALRFATDRRTLRDKVGHGVNVLQDAAFPQTDPAVPKDIGFVEYAPSKANKLLDAAGWERGPDGVRTKNGVRLSIDAATVSGSPDVDTSIELLRGWWKEAGIELNVKHYASSLLFAPAAEGGILSGGKFDIAYVGWTYPVPLDPYPQFACDAAPPKAQNVSHYCNPVVDRAIADLHRSYDEKRRAADMARILRRVAEDVPVIVMSGRENLFGFNKDLKNFRPNGVTVFDDMMNVDI